MAVSASPDEPASQRYREDLEGLDPHDPEVREFAAHLDRIEKSRSGYTVEGYLGGISDFADSANRLGGYYRMLALLVIGLILIGVGVAAWDALVFILS
ncbi:hypothetical protein [Kibdelosporangium phytohabitans]|uniref:Uncharacterized protein n=1 Tax=Kibdelosporangium phytohabitans TaxID=860235 RepID=A0A0N9IH39_9PSEU|nr:hypothetical protein [Kibdelosporangium phytohabitans]ALG14796.1 hypothetical protein AOZ06_14905 [Kibdelosporangium phytohabitans]MBE1471004.1 hypothetical protein [Kibdelosporangium phytohabitans]